MAKTCWVKCACKMCGKRGLFQSNTAPSSGPAGHLPPSGGEGERPTAAAYRWNFALSFSTQGSSRSRGRR